MASQYNTNLNEKTGKDEDRDKCISWLRRNCNVEKGQHCQMHCKSQRYNEFMDLVSAVTSNDI